LTFTGLHGVISKIKEVLIFKCRVVVFIINSGHETDKKGKAIPVTGHGGP
jgi:hypothetical protein